MKRVLCMLIAVITVLSVFGTTVFAADDVKVNVNGEEVVFDQPPVIKGGRTLVPARAVFEAIGASVFWDATEDGGYVSVVTADKSIVLEVNRKNTVDYMIIDNIIKVALDVPATIIGGRTLVPLRAIGDALSCDVGWDGETRTASLVYDELQSSGLTEETIKANEALSIAKASEELKKASSKEITSTVPKYFSGVKYFDVVSVDEQKKYKITALEGVKAEDYSIYAKINDDYITRDELEYFLAIYTDSQGTVSEENIEMAKSNVMELAVSASYAKSNGVVINSDLIKVTNLYLNSATYGLDLDTFASLCGIDKETIYVIAEKQAMRNALFIEAEESGALDISDSALKARFNSVFYKAKHILIKTIDDSMNPVSETEKKNAKKTADGILAKIKKGEDFDKLMKENSEDSETSYEGYVFTDGQMVKSFEDGVKALKAGEVSPVIESEYGYHIIKRLELNADAEAETYEYYKTSLMNLLASEYFEVKTKEWSETMEIKIF